MMHYLRKIICWGEVCGRRLKKIGLPNYREMARETVGMENNEFQFRRPMLEF